MFGSWEKKSKKMIEKGKKGDEMQKSNQLFIRVLVSRCNRFQWVKDPDRDKLHCLLSSTSARSSQPKVKGLFLPLWSLILGEN